MSGVPRSFYAYFMSATHVESAVTQPRAFERAFFALIYHIAPFCCPREVAASALMLHADGALRAQRVPCRGFKARREQPLPRDERFYFVRYSAPRKCHEHARGAARHYYDDAMPPLMSMRADARDARRDVIIMPRACAAASGAAAMKTLRHARERHVIVD